MHNALLYILTAIIWGSTWIAIEFQLGEVPVMVSLVYRFGISALLMWGYCLYKKLPLRYTKKDHLFIFLMALFNFSMNYVLIYYSQYHLTSAMTSIIFSTMLLMNIINTRLFFGNKISHRVYIGALFGILGIVILFWHELSATTSSDDSNIIFGFSLAIGSSLAASFGNMASVRNSSKSINIFSANAWGMLYGTLILVTLVFITGAEFTISTELSYLVSLGFLSVFGTVIAFATFYILLNNMGPEKASYVIVLIPIVAVLISTVFEDFTWTSNTFIGFISVLTGNAILLTPLEKLRHFIDRNSIVKNKTTN